VRGPQSGHHSLAPPTWKVHVEKDDVRIAARNCRDGVFDVVRFADDIDLISELGSNPGPEQAVIIDDHHAWQLHAVSAALTLEPAG
jgi:L-alanine-DL-glutamate epimerase-like enolase superfamily enzyme